MHYFQLYNNSRDKCNDIYSKVQATGYTKKQEDQIKLLEKEERKKLKKKKKECTVLKKMVIEGYAMFTAKETQGFLKMKN